MNHLVLQAQLTASVQQATNQRGPQLRVLRRHVLQRQVMTGLEALDCIKRLTALRLGSPLALTHKLLRRGRFGCAAGEECCHLRCERVCADPLSYLGAGCFKNTEECSVLNSPASPAVNSK
eukprot:GHUV01027759.1.p2 GENE.GHUV01027759.1~~GHUV01027759.1.p2  ORF type:complete len:121 (+),score=5.11 GHUV01027759.1:1248-1610(+)